MSVSLGFWQISTLFSFAFSLTLIETMGGGGRASVKVESGLQRCLRVSQKITVGRLQHHFCCCREKKNRKCKWFGRQFPASCMKERECDTRLKGQQRESSQSSQAFANEVISEMVLDRKKNMFLGKCFQLCLFGFMKGNSSNCWI